MIDAMKRGQYWSFWCQEWSNHQDQDVIWWNRAFEAVEVIVVAEADEVKEAAEVLRPEKSLLRTSESSRFLNSDLFWCFEEFYLFYIIIKYHIEFWHLFCQRLLRPANVTFLETKDEYQKFPISEFQNHFHTRFYLHISLCQSQFIKSSSMWDTLYISKNISLRNSYVS